jgi:hypothetical protein
MKYIIFKSMISEAIYIWHQGSSDVVCLDPGINSSAVRRGQIIRVLKSEPEFEFIYKTVAKGSMFKPKYKVLSKGNTNI